MILDERAESNGITPAIPFTTDKKETFGYEITKGILFSNGNGFALGEKPRFIHAPYATYQILDDKGIKRYCSAHNFIDARAAAADYQSRIFEYRAKHPDLKEIRTEQTQNREEETFTLAEQLAEAKKQMKPLAAGSPRKKRDKGLG